MIKVDNELPTITKDIVIGDCDNCIHNKENPFGCNTCSFNEKDLGFNGYEYIPPSTGCPQKPQTYIFNFVEPTADAS